LRCCFGAKSAAQNDSGYSKYDDHLFYIGIPQFESEKQGGGTFKVTIGIDKRSMTNSMAAQSTLLHATLK
jgi:hypothetical protein